MRRYLWPAVLVVLLAAPTAAHAQHTNAGGAPSAGTAVPVAPPPAPAPSPAPASQPASTSSGGGGGIASGGSTSSGAGHRRGNAPATGSAVARGTSPSPGGGVVISDGFYPWGYGAGILGLYGGYYGGYYGAYDPWYGWYPTYAPIASGSASEDTGAIRLKVKPDDASVYVDGFYVGVVNDFDGTFQRLRLTPGPHRIEIRSQDYSTLSLDVMIQDGLTITYQGDLAKQ